MQRVYNWCGAGLTMLVVAVLCSLHLWAEYLRWMNRPDLVPFSIATGVIMVVLSAVSFIVALEERRRFRNLDFWICKNCSRMNRGVADFCARCGTEV